MPISPSGEIFRRGGQCVTGRDAMRHSTRVGYGTAKRFSMPLRCDSVPEVVVPRDGR